MSFLRVRVTRKDGSEVKCWEQESTDGLKVVGFVADDRSAVTVTNEDRVEYINRAPIEDPWAPPAPEPEVAVDPAQPVV